MRNARSDPRIRPGRWLYVVAALSLIVGAASLWMLFTGFTGFSRDAARIAAPGQEQITLSDSGSYGIAYEYRSVLDGRAVTAPEAMPAMNIGVLSVDTHAPVPVKAVGGQFTYAAGDAAGRLVATFSVDRAGDYIVASEYADHAEQPKAVLAIGADPTEFFVPFLIIGVVGVLLAPVIWLITFIRRRVSRKRSQQSMPPIAGTTAAEGGTPSQPAP
jgi:hypothetical protein